MKNSFPKRGEMWLVNYEPHIGSEQSGTRPSIILQNNIGNKYSSTIIVLPLSTKIKKYPFRICLNPEDGVGVISDVLVNQLHTIDKKRLIKKLGTLNPAKWDEIKKALLISTGFHESVADEI